MDLIFNELSVFPLCQDKTESYNRVSEFVKTFKKVNTKGFKKIRFDMQYHEIKLSPEYTLADFCKDAKDRNTRTLLLGIRKYPYIDDDSEQETTYIQNTYSIDKNGNREKCYGLAAAYLYSTSGIGFLSEPFWDQVKFKIIIENSNYIEDDVLCLSHENHVENAGFKSWVESLENITLIESDLAPKDKEIKFRDDHGTDILQAFAERLVTSPYVTKIINSIRFNPHARSFIKKIYPDGKIEFILINTDAGNGMIIQTTGRNIRETKEIARILKEKYND